MKSGNIRTKRMAPIIIAAYILAAGVTGCIQESAPPAASGEKSTVPESGGTAADTTRRAEGEALFRQMCVSCHGTAGNGRGSRSGPSLQRPELTHGSSREAIMQSIRGGRPGGMPSFGHALTPAQLESLATYVQGLKK